MLNKENLYFVRGFRDFKIFVGDKKKNFNKKPIDLEDLFWIGLVIMYCFIFFVE